MSNRDVPGSFLPVSKARRDVEGLRDGDGYSNAKVYRLNPDGTKGEFLREEEPIFFIGSFGRTPRKEVINE